MLLLHPETALLKERHAVVNPPGQVDLLDFMPTARRSFALIFGFS
jgi:hypothetical protein